MHEEPTSAFRIERVVELPADLEELIAASLLEEFPAIRRLRDEWESKANRFDGPGELLLAAYAGHRLVGICGLNRDPYALPTSNIGRVRHLYVAPDVRRAGVRRLLLAPIIARARQYFVRLRLRTLRADADQFYLALGFRRLDGEADATHEL